MKGIKDNQIIDMKKNWKNRLHEGYNSHTGLFIDDKECKELKDLIILLE